MKIDDAYQQWKREFEKSHCKVINKSIFIKCLKDENGIILERKELVTSYEHIKVQKEVYNEKKDEIVIVHVDCISEWLGDIEMMMMMYTYDDMNVYPPSTICPPNIFNLWTPYYADQLPKSMLEEKEDLNNIEKVNSVSELIKVLCNRYEKDSIFVMNFIGQLLIYPALKTYCLTIISKEGAGKGTLAYLIERLVGERKFLDIYKEKMCTMIFYFVILFYMFERLKKTTNALIFGRNGISPNVSKFMRDHSDEPILEMIISRNVVSSILTGSMKLEKELDQINYII